MTYLIFDIQKAILCLFIICQYLSDSDPLHISNTPIIIGLTAVLITILAYILSSFYYYYYFFLLIIIIFQNAPCVLLSMFHRYILALG